MHQTGSVTFLSNMRQMVSRFLVKIFSCSFSFSSDKIPSKPTELEKF